MGLLPVGVPGEPVELRVFENFLTQRTTEMDPASIPRYRANKTTVWERRFSGVRGWLHRINCYMSHYQDQQHHMVDITLEDPETHALFIVTLYAKDRYGRTTLHRLLNTGALDITQPLELRPYHFNDKATGQLRKGISVLQGGKRVPPRWTREQPGELPPMVSYIEDGVERWNSDEQLAFVLEQTKALAQRIAEVADARNGAHQQPALSGWDEQEPDTVFVEPMDVLPAPRHGIDNY